jgi:hypothetical protein
MAKKFLTSIDLNKNELQNVALQNLSSDPSSPVAGQVYYNTTDKVIRQYNGTAWKSYTQSGAIVNADIASNAAIDLSKLATDPVARANHTGTQTASTISDLATTVKAYRLDEFAAPTANVSLNNNKITNVLTPTSDNDAANKKYVDDSIAGLTWKDAVNLLAASNVALTGSTGTLVIDGHSALDETKNGYRILLTAQTTTADKGIYTYSDAGSGYTLTRSTDADVYTELIDATVFVQEGTTYGDTVWTQSNHYITTFASQNWVQFSGGETVSAGTGLTKDGTVINANGTADRISVSSDAIDIASTYVGQSTITTLGTITTGTWNGTDVAVSAGGTGASDAATARTNLGLAIGTDVQGYNATLAAVAGGTYTGDDSISTVGTITAGVWTGTDIAVADGGTGASTAAGAKTNLGFVTKYSVKNGSITPSGGVATWSIPASTHGVATTGAAIVQMKEVSGAVVEADVSINDTTGDVTITWNASSTVSADTYRVTIIG